MVDVSTYRPENLPNRRYLRLLSRMAIFVTSTTCPSMARISGNLLLMLKAEHDSQVPSWPRMVKLKYVKSPRVDTSSETRTTRPWMVVEVETDAMSSGKSGFAI